MKTLLLMIGLSLFSLSSHAENLCETSFENEVAPISKAMEERTDPNRWKKYETFLKKFGPCLDASYAETVQDISEKGLAHDWDRFAHYVQSQKPDPKILRSNIETGFDLELGTHENLLQIQKNAKTNCPKKLKHFCAEILKAKIP